MLECFIHSTVKPVSARTVTGILSRTLECILFFAVLCAVSPAFSVAAASAGDADTTRATLVELPAPAGSMGSATGQHAAVGAVLPRPFRVRAEISGGAPATGRLVRFEIVSVPEGAKDAKLSADTVLTNDDGYAQTSLRLGSEPGVYLVTASIRDSSGDAGVVVFRALARKSNWIFMLVVGLAGGLGIFLFGLKVMSEGMTKTASNRVRSILSTFTYNRFVAVGAGAFVTMLVQSSSATTVMLVSFVRAGMMTFPQSIGMILGADIGATITVQLIAFRLTDYALLFVVIGIALSMLSKKDTPRNVGETILGFGLLFFGMHIMSESMAPLRTLEGFVNLLVTLENPALGILVGAIFTALIQSSGAFAGILIILATQGLLPLEAAIPLLFGANIGTCVTALLAGIGTNREARRVALTHILFKVMGVLVFVWWIPEYAAFIRNISPAGDPAAIGFGGLAEILPRQIANAHTIFNVGLTIAMLPFTATAARLVTRLLPDKPKTTEAPYRTRHIDKALLSTPALALNMAKAEILHMATIVEVMIENIIRPFVSRDKSVLDEIENSENRVNFLSDAINNYLAQISQRSLAGDRTEEVFQMMYTTTELEQIGDIIYKNLLPRTHEWLDKDLRFSDEGRGELINFHAKTKRQFARAINVFEEVNLEAVSRIKEKHKKYRAMQDEYLRSHFERIRRKVPGTLETTEYHQELMEQLRRITSHSTRIARILLEWTEEQAAAKEKK